MTGAKKKKKRHNPYHIKWFLKKNPLNIEIVKKKKPFIVVGSFFSIEEDCYSVKKIFVHDKSEVDALLPF